MPVQTTYTSKPTAGISGQLADSGKNASILPMYNSEGSASVPFGFGVKFGSTSGTDQDALLPAGTSDKLAGIVVWENFHSSATGGDLDSTGLKAGAMMNVIRKGQLLVTCEDGCAPGDRLYVRCTSAGTGKGTLRSTDPGGSTVIDATGQGQWLTTATAGNLAVLEVDFVSEA